MPKETQRDNSHTVMPVKSLEELMRWKRHVREHYTLKEYTFMELGLDTGAHPDDLLGLKWEDLQYEEASNPLRNLNISCPPKPQTTFCSYGKNFPTMFIFSNRNPVIKAVRHSTGKPVMSGNSCVFLQKKSA